MFFLRSTRCLLLTLLVLGLTAAASLAGEGSGTLNLQLRSRVEPFKGSGQWQEVKLPAQLKGNETAILICDMWDKHWCPTANERCGVLARKMVPVLDAARKQGVLVIHAPSECMSFYQDAPQRRRILEAQRTQPPKGIELSEPPLPVDASDGGCDTDEPVKSYKAWSRQNATIPIAEGDVISDNGAEIYSYLTQRGIKNLVVMGVHTNMCVLGRSFGIRQMTKWGMRCVLVRDLTDAMYNPKKPPFVSHDEGTELIVQHIEKHWCPTVLSSDILKGAGR